MFFLCLLFSLTLSAQNSYNYKAIYELSYVRDSSSVKESKELLVLLLNENQESFFQNYRQFKMDSTKTSEMKGLGAFIGEKVITKNSSKKIDISRNFNSVNTYYTEDIPQDWKITTSESIINGIKCKEATLQAYGRNWTACYSEDYPFQFGPYLFAGLPGLIVKVEDQQKYFSFTLSSFKKENNVIMNKNEGKEVSKVKFYEMTYDSDFSGTIFNSFRMEDAAQKENLRIRYMEALKRKNTFPIDKSMRYIFNR